LFGEDGVTVVIKDVLGDLLGVGGQGDGEPVIDGVHGVISEIGADWGIRLVSDDVEYVVCEG